MTRDDSNLRTARHSAFMSPPNLTTIANLADFIGNGDIDRLLVQGRRALPARRAVSFSIPADCATALFGEYSRLHSRSRRRTFRNDGGENPRMRADM